MMEKKYGVHASLDGRGSQWHRGDQRLANRASTLAFDTNGNMTTDEQGRTLGYDSWNRLVAVKNGSTTLASYKLDGLARRIVETASSNTRCFCSNTKLAAWWDFVTDISGKHVGALRFYRHIDPVTGRGAVSHQADKEEIPLDFRQFPMDILLRSGPYVNKGHWGKQQRLVVTEAHASPFYSHRCGNEITATEPSPDRAPDCR